VELNGKDLSCYSDKTESVGLRKSDIMITNISRGALHMSMMSDPDQMVNGMVKCLDSRLDHAVDHLVRHVQHSLVVLRTTWRQKPAGIDMERNYVTVTLCVGLWCFCRLAFAAWA